MNTPEIKERDINFAGSAAEPASVARRTSAYAISKNMSVDSALSEGGDMK
ncbi:uncharacterized protein G2W53_024092 [Senna tora]|uniref:Uncharacterized protein n=1 Tax=Senna tora TaxID=362788 RepID=A0A834TB07_9FABA|nr:uncharacterized protein G2W53_024092 [Senna tora]